MQLYAPTSTTATKKRTRAPKLAIPQFLKGNQQCSKH